MGVASSSRKRNADYDPQRKWGLSPAEGTAAPSTDATYIVAGHVVAGTAGKRDLFLSESVGREAQARAARQASSRDTDAMLKRLLKHDKEGMKAVQAAHEFAKNARDKEAKALGSDSRLSLEKKKKSEGRASENHGDGDGYVVFVDADRSTKNAYSAQVIKELGFDPTRGRRKVDDDPRKLYSKVRPSSKSPNGAFSCLLLFIGPADRAHVVSRAGQDQSGSSARRTRAVSCLSSEAKTFRKWKFRGRGI
jgi:minichromosome maintenance protein 10